MSDEKASASCPCGASMSISAYSVREFMRAWQKEHGGHRCTPVRPPTVAEWIILNRHKIPA